MKFGVFASKEFTDVLVKLFKTEVPVKTAYKLGKIQKLLAEENARYDELRQEIVKKYGEKDDKGELKVDELGNIRIEEKSTEKFMNEMRDLISIEFDTPKVSMNDLGELQLSSTELLMLEDLLEDSE